LGTNAITYKLPNKDRQRKGDMALTNANNEIVFSFRIPSSDTHIDFLK